MVRVTVLMPVQMRDWIIAQAAESHSSMGDWIRVLVAKERRREQ